MNILPLIIHPKGIPTHMTLNRKGEFLKEYSGHFAIGFHFKEKYQ